MVQRDPGDRLPGQDGDDLDPLRQRHGDDGSDREQSDPPATEGL
jgi:hypothetical protein